MASVFDVAKYILHKCGEMSTWKLQKLCYYAQAWHLAWTGNELFPEDFEAWANGPVCPELFQAHKGKFVLGQNELPKGDSLALSKDEKDSVDVMLRGYGGRAPYDLREQSHSEPPWKDARHGLPEGAWGNDLITKASMGEYYGSL